MVKKKAKQPSSDGNSQESQQKPETGGTSASTDPGQAVKIEPEKLTSDSTQQQKQKPPFKPFSQQQQQPGPSQEPPKDAPQQIQPQESVKAPVQQEQPQKQKKKKPAKQQEPVSGSVSQPPLVQVAPQDPGQAVKIEPEKLTSDSTQQQKQKPPFKPFSQQQQQPGPSQEPPKDAPQQIQPQESVKAPVQQEQPQKQKKKKPAKQQEPVSGSVSQPPLVQVAPQGDSGSIKSPDVQKQQPKKKGKGGSAAKSDTAGQGGDKRSVPSPSVPPPKQGVDSSDKSLVIPKRKGTGGTIGEKCRVETNFLGLQLNLKSKICHYDIQFKPEAPKRLFRPVFYSLLKKHFPRRFPSFDGRKNIYSCGELPLKNNLLNDTIVVKDSESDKDKEFDVEIKLVATVNMDRLYAYMKMGNSHDIPQDCIQALDIALRSKPYAVYTPVGRSFFKEPTRTLQDLGDGLEVWHGFYQSCVVGWNKCYLNIDVAHKGFPKRTTVIDYLREHCNYSNGRGLDLRSEEKAKKFLKGLRIEYRMPVTPQAFQRRSYTVRDLSKSPNAIKFRKDENSREISITSYFLTEKGYKIQYTDLPCIQVSQGTHLPLELCSIVANQAVNRKLNETQTANMVKFAAKPPEDRKRTIMDAVSGTQYNNDPCLKEFGVTVEEKFVTLDARVLPAPSLEYAGKRTVNPVDGVWRGAQFLKPAILNNWAVLNLSTVPMNVLMGAIKTLIDCGSQDGLRMAQPKAVVPGESRTAPETVVRALNNLLQRHGDLELILIVMPISQVYSIIKRAAELNVGVLTQCLQSKTVFKMNLSTAKNILFKINTKLNGTNHKIPESQLLFMKVPTMIVGADVTHPSPDQTEIPSIAAVSASYDPCGFRYMMEYCLQSARQEIIVHLEQIMCKMLQNFIQKTGGREPLVIIYYRDGVSEGQFYDVLSSELKAIRIACMKTLKNPPKITVLVVQKRHHTRFFPTNPKFTSKTGNVIAGTVVDTQITHPTEMDFYLVSHASIKGTARPTKYHVLYDDNNFAPDDLERFTYQLCHLYARCSRSVSYPAPTYYAHLAAFRARVYMEQKRLTNDDMENLNTEKHCGLVKKEVCQRNPMFFV